MQIESSMVSNAEYDQMTGTLTLTFRSGGTYEYNDVSLEDAAELEAASSFGQCFHDIIKPYKSFTRVS